MSPCTLAELVERAAAELKDSEHLLWSEDDLEQHIRRALAAYNRINPRRLATTLDSAAKTRLYSLEELLGMMQVLDVHYPYNPEDPAYPPSRPQWSTPQDGHLHLDVADPPSGAESAKIHLFYTTAHTISGLDDAEESTLDAQGEEIVVLGATAYAAQQMGGALIGTVTVSGWTPEQYQRLAERRLVLFEAALEGLRRRLNAMQDARASWQAPARPSSRRGIV
jgi:hypothetical protein